MNNYHIPNNFDIIFKYSSININLLHVTCNRLKKTFEVLKKTPFFSSSHEQNDRK